MPDFELQSALSSISERLQLNQLLIVSSLPRGELQVLQAQPLSPLLVRAHAKHFHAEDRVAWGAIASRRPIRENEAWPHGDLESTRFFRELLRPNGFAHVMAAPLVAPVLEGYPGVIEAFRPASQPAFSDDDRRVLVEAAESLNALVDRIRAGRNDAKPEDRQQHEEPATGLFVFDSKISLAVGSQQFSRLDPKLRENIIDAARQRLAELSQDAAVGTATHVSDRLTLPDSNGDLRNFRVLAQRHFPALGEGAYVFFSMQPSCTDWKLLRESDFAADPEIARLVPAVRFMGDEFYRSPTLQDIARSVHLSPFHFHRRFTELMGITPKHFLLDCQIERAKRQLSARERELSDISADCGFAHQSHFTSRFKQATGLTPTRWRRQVADQRAS